MAEQPVTSSGPIRCAIYTRKSTEEGLEQAFNSLDAQREAAEAYILSQRHLGWSLIAERYDDGGFSGGNLDRPALQRLLGDMEAQRVAIVVVYKIDRLSRSLLDFARLMDRFDQRSVSFVSVTQQFNTTTSLGRLTLNILLSFAQFERELISERTRDKMAAARRKGMWVGGTPLLGFDVDPRGGRLVVNEKEAKRVCEIFELYERHRSLATVVAELDRRGWTTKVWKSKRGVRHTGRPFTKASVRLLLTNSTYAGKVTYRGAVYAGEHSAIVDVALWEEIQADFLERQHTNHKPRQSEQKALLAGVLYCQSCQTRMVATYSMKRGRQYRYYVCRQARQKGWHQCPTKAISASLIEDSLVGQLRVRLDSEETRSALHLAQRDWQAFLHDPAGLVPALVEAVRYDGASGTVSVQLRALNGNVPEVRP